MDTKTKKLLSIAFTSSLILLLAWYFLITHSGGRLHAIAYSPYLDAMNLPLFFVIYVLFLLPGLLAVGWLIKQEYIGENYTLLCAFGISCLIGYAVFWFYFIDASLGKTVSLFLILTIIILLCLPFFRNLLWNVLSLDDVKTPAALILLIGLLYTSIVYFGYFEWRTERLPSAVPGFIVERTISSGSADYLNQKATADLLYSGESIWNRVICSYKTTLADRPPLLSGIALMFYVIPEALKFYYFMAISTIAQLAWIPAVWALFRILQLSLRKAAILTIIISQTGFFFFYSVFTWPKLLPGALVVGTFLLLILKPYLSRRPPSMIDVAAGSVLFSLGVLCHFGVATIILPIGILTLFPRFYPGKAALLAGALAFVLLVGPWVVEKGIHEPEAPGLARFLLTDPEDKGIYDNDSLSLAHAVTRTYSNLTIIKVLKLKIDSLGKLAYLPANTVREITKPDSRAILRLADIYAFFRAFGALNIAWLFIVPTMVVRGRRLNGIDRAVRLMAYVAMSTVGLTVLLMFNVHPFVHYLSFAAMVLLFACLAVKIIHLNRWLIASVFGASLLYFWYVWLPFRPGQALAVNWPIAAFAVAVGILLFAFPFSIKDDGTEIETGIETELASMGA